MDRRQQLFHLLPSHDDAHLTRVSRRYFGLSALIQAYWKSSSACTHVARGLYLSTRLEPCLLAQVPQHDLWPDPGGAIWSVSCRSAMDAALAAHMSMGLHETIQDGGQPPSQHRTA